MTSFWTFDDVRVVIGRRQKLLKGAEIYNVIHTWLNIF